MVKAENLKKSFGDRVLFENMSFDLPPGGIVGVIGPNGAGKTTLFKMIMGQEKPDSGTLKVGETVQLSYVDQSRDALDAKKTVYQEISGGYDILKWAVSRFMREPTAGDLTSRGPISRSSWDSCPVVNATESIWRSCFVPEQPAASGRTHKRPRCRHTACSGGRIVQFWRLCRGGQPRPLVSGPYCDHILAFEGDRSVVWCEGNYRIYEQQRRERLGDDADRPAGGRFKPLSR